MHAEREHFHGWRWKVGSVESRGRGGGRRCGSVRQVQVRVARVPEVSKYRSAGEGEEDRQNVVGGGSTEARRLKRRIGYQ